MIKSNGKNFNLDVKGFAKALEVDVGTVMARSILGIHGDVVKLTPRDTGRAAASWTLGLNKVDRSRIRGGKKKAKIFC